MKPENQIVQAVITHFSKPKFEKFVIVTNCEIQMGTDNSREADVVLHDVEGNFIVIVECKSQGGANYGISQLKSYLSATDTPFGIFAPSENRDAWVLYQNLRRNSFYQIDNWEDFERGIFSELDICERFAERINFLKNMKSKLENEINQQEQQRLQTYRELQSIRQLLRDETNQCGRTNTNSFTISNRNSSLEDRIYAKFFKSKTECLDEVKRLKSLQLPLLPEVIPPELVDSVQWVVWSYEVDERINGIFRPTKIPYQPNNPGLKASMTYSAEWSNLEAAMECVQNYPYIDGIGFVFSSADGFIGVDFDNCMNPETGHIRIEFRLCMEKLGGYAEVSPSRTGVKVWVKGTLEDKFFKTELSRGFKILNFADGDIEVYRQGQYFTVTTQFLEGFDSITDSQAGIDMIGELSLLHTTIDTGYGYADELDTLLSESERLTMQQNSKNNYLIDGIISYLRFIQWNFPHDLELAINFPEVRIDDLTLVRLKWLAQHNEIELGTLLKNIDEYPNDVGPLTRRNIRDFWTLIEQLENVISVEIDQGIKMLLDLLELSRSPYRSMEQRIIEYQPEIPNLAVASDILCSAIDNGNEIQITASYGIDEYCAAYMIRQTLESYLNKTIQVEFLSDQSVIMSTDDQEQYNRFEYSSDENAVHLLIGDFWALNGETMAKNMKKEVETQIGTILIGCDSEVDIDSQVIHLKTNSIHSITTLKLCQRVVSRFDMPNMADMVIYDLETTGVNPKNANIVEIAAKRLNVIGNEVEQYYKLVKPPGGYIPPSATRIHGISMEDVKDAPSIEMVLPEFCSFIQDRILIGHNITQYNNPILERDLKEYPNRSLLNPYYDTFETAQRLFPIQQCSMAALAEKFGIEHGRLDNAMEDVAVNRNIFKELITINSQKREVESLTHFLPLVGLSILAKFSGHEIMRTAPGVCLDDVKITEIGAFLNVAKRFVQLDETKNPIEILPLRQREKEKVQVYLNELKHSDTPDFPEDLTWRNSRIRLINAVHDFLSIYGNWDLINFLDYYK